MALNKTPRQNKIREALGRIYDQHPPHFREYLERFKEDPTSRIFAPLAEAYRRMGKVEEAIEICKKGLEHHPDFYGGRVALAKCYIDEKDFNSAKRELELVVASAPDNLMAQRLLGDMFLATDDKRAAIHAYKMALLLSPADVALSEKVYGLEKTLIEVQPPPPLVAAPIELAVDSIEEDPKENTVSHIVSLEELEQQDSTQDEEIEVLASPPEETEEESFVVLEPVPHVEDEDIESDPRVKNEINALIGLKEEEAEEDSFQVGGFATAFADKEKELHREITTTTLGDLYLGQEQYQNALEIFERIYRDTKNPEILRKIHACQTKLGVDSQTLVRNRKIETLRSILRNKDALRTG